MASRIRASATPDEVWHVLCDPWLYASWVVGSSRIRDVDEHWPNEGSRFHHSIGLWPLLDNDYTEVVSCDPGRMIELAAHSWPAGKARVRLGLTKEPEGCEIVLEEWVDSWPWKAIPKRVQEKLAAPRNRECLRRLALIAEGRHE
ncbi:SRPBCC family protein [Hoyosella subflava]|uniref:Polyketide cyclase/dehydrase n=1 Tax=Hoyosella subflava (strain DSM 45089 / JCM 17490 / NBRC 109087 / DQS3-9A1) TaxID=443218 RepID=F6EGE0_HOYSD|nr:SRPBCC family protein [Hoyosella subflava]AEF39865.1 Polyketide cyclase/dehydrase [Hoyosella subflava DQS3-9A1]